MAYQCAAGGVPIEDVMAVSRVVVGECKPDLTIIFDVDTETAFKRIHTLDRIEQKGFDYHNRVRNGYLAQAKLSEASFAVIDATKDVDDVFSQVLSALDNKL